jgi:hypothetical protein
MAPKRPLPTGKASVHRAAGRSYQIFIGRRAGDARGPDACWADRRGQDSVDDSKKKLRLAIHLFICKSNQKFQLSDLAILSIDCNILPNLTQNLNW